MKSYLNASALLGLTLAVFSSSQSIAFAADAPQPIAARQAVMKSLKDAMGPLGGMAKGAIAFDADTAALALAALNDATAQIQPSFETNATDEKSEALPVIWETWDDFVSKSEDLEFALEAWDVSTLDNLRAGMGNVGATCGACHKIYRMKKN